MNSFLVGNECLTLYFQVIQLYCATSRSVQDAGNIQTTRQEFPHNSGSSNKENNNEKVISVRITSSVAVGRGNGKPIQRADINETKKEHFRDRRTTTEASENKDEKENITDLPVNLKGANIEFLKQLNAKTEERGDHFQSAALRYDNDGRISHDTKNDRVNIKEEDILDASKILSSDDYNDFGTKSISILDDALKLSEERINHNNSTDSEMFSTSKPATENHYLSTLYDESEFNSDDKNRYSHLDNNKESKEIDDSVAESSIKSVLKIANKHSDDYENIENVPLARSLEQSPSSKNYIQGLINKPPSERESSTRVTTVSFNIVHDNPKILSFNDPGQPFSNPSKSFQELQKFYESPTIYSRPAQIYSEPAKIYSVPAKIYSEPAKIYSEPSKIYSEPAKIYSVPAKFYSEPASLHLKASAPRNYSPWQQPPPPTSTTLNTTPVTTITIPDSKNTPPTPQQVETNYEADEKDVITDGQSHGVEESTTEKCKQDNCKVGYVVKGRQFNKYRVEERTSDGFIVGEYGVVRNEDGALRGVRYTADSEASSRLINDALMKFLQLK